MAIKLASIPKPEYSGRGKSQFQMQLMDKEPNLDALVCEKGVRKYFLSWMLTVNVWSKMPIIGKTKLSIRESRVD